MSAPVMPSSQPPVPREFVQTFHQATKVPGFVWDSLNANQVNANHVLPVLLKCMALERSGRMSQGHLWIVNYTLAHPHAKPQVRFVLACTDGNIGKYPIFIFTPIPYAYLQYDTGIHNSMALLANELRKNQPDERTYSVFAVDIATTAWVHVWTRLTRIGAVQEPYYHAKVSFLTRGTFIPRDLPLPPDEAFELRPGTPQDINEIARLCYMFADESPPFRLNQQNAIREATQLVERGQVWVHKWMKRGCPPRIVSIVAFTRNSDRVATITKVYTDPECRGRKCAERLVRAVCYELLKTKEKVALFVGLTNKAAIVYSRVGFVGIGDHAAPVNGVDTWLEIGFDPAHVRLGHW
ncbi:unnamed protein product [Cyclocybe aegerita]|uniref:N-acetyltransferase domain-containing protein n=1 Tax=Cyclocybe aegerita TaxID=1973307 RepID=A0A8S0WWE4_CYCAE|nr:unnamed protein product [Cyclocybe aegerita]